MNTQFLGTWVACLLLWAVPTKGQLPGWTAPDPAQFGFSATAIVAPVLDDSLRRNPGDRLAFFSDQQIRGLSSFLFGVHFVQLYSNQPMDTFSVQYYHAPEDTVYILQQPFYFEQGLVNGLIYDPILLFVPGQQGPKLSFTNIPDQIGIVNQPFDTLDLGLYLNFSEGDSLVWSIAFPPSLQATLVGSQLAVRPVDDFTGFATLSARVEIGADPNCFSEIDILYVILPDMVFPAWEVVPGQGVLMGNRFLNLCDESDTILLDLKDFVRNDSLCLEFDFVPLVEAAQPTTPQPDWEISSIFSDSMVLYLRTQYTEQRNLWNKEDVLGVFSGQDLVGLAAGKDRIEDAVLRVVVGNSTPGEILSFSFYSTELGRLLNHTEEITYLPGQQLGSPHSPLVLDFSPLRPTLSSEGALSMEILQEDWVGEQTFVFYFRDCDFPKYLFSEQRVTFSVVSSVDQLQFYYKDGDENGLGNPLIFTQHSISPTGFVSNGLDCAEAIPQGTCQDTLSLLLNEVGMGILVPSEALQALSNACGLESLAFSKLAFGCEDLGNQALDLEMTDKNGNTRVLPWVVSLKDTLPPMVRGPDRLMLSSCLDPIPDVQDLFTIEDNCEGWTVSQQPKPGIPFSSLGSQEVLVLIQVEDASGNRVDQSLLLGVEDQQSPEFVNCPNATFTLGAEGDCQGGVVWSIPYAVDDCGPVRVVETSVGGPYYGQRLSPGVYAIEYTATDLAGNSSTCGFTVIIADNFAPLLVCLPNAQRTTDPGKCSFTSGIEEFNPLLTIDNCPDYTLMYTLSGVTQGQGQGPLPSMEFNVGITYIEYLLIDLSGNSVECQFELEVLDREPPLVQCPPSMIVDSEEGICGALVVYDFLEISDNCGIASEDSFEELIVNGGFETGDLTDWQGTQLDLLGFCFGPDWVIYQGTGVDNRCLGNDFTPVSGNFALYTAFDGDGPVSYQIEQNIQLPSTVVEANLSWLETYEFLVQGAFPRSLRVVILDSSGEELAVLYHHDYRMGTFLQSGWQSRQVRVGDLLRPFAGQEVVLRISAEIPESFTGPSGFAIDDLSLKVNTNPAIQVLEGFASGSIFPVGVTPVVLETQDVWGNTATCAFTVTVMDREGPSLACPTDTLLYMSSSPQGCGVLYEWEVPVPTDNCGIAHYFVKYTFPNGTIEGPLPVYDYTPGSYGNMLTGFSLTKVFPLGTTLVEYFAEDAAGNTESCSFSVEVWDDIPPIFENCPQGEIFTLSLFPGSCEGAAIWSIPIATDNCGIQSLRQTAGPSPGSILWVGDYTLRYTAEDFSGNTTHCQFTIRITDTQNPLLVCPANVLLVGTDPGQCSWTSQPGLLRPLLSSNNCPALLSWVISGATQASGQGEIVHQTFEIGQSLVTYRLEEIESGQVWECSFEVQVQDREPPQVACPERLILECGDPDNEDKVNAWLQSIPVTDHCTTNPEKFISLFSNESLCGQTSLARYMIKAIDAEGNEGICFADIQFLDRTAPVLVKEAKDLEVACSGTLASAEILAWLNANGFAEVTESCGTIFWTHDFNKFNAECGGAGEFEVVFTARDACGNQVSTQAKLIVKDILPPVWEKLPTDKVIECQSSSEPSVELAQWLANQGGGLAVDLCSSLRYEHEMGPWTEDCGPVAGSAWVIFMAVDDCGNTATANAMVSIVDREGPVIVTQARDTIVECNGNGNREDLEVWLQRQAGAKALDLCSEGIHWAYEALSTQGGCEGSFHTRYRFFAKDECGNTSVNTEASFSVVDTAPPHWIRLPKDTMVSCQSAEALALWLSQHGGALAEDLCSQPTYSYSLVSNTPLCGLGFESEYRFTATDLCGNAVHATARFIAQDTEPPILTGGSDYLHEDCGQGPLGDYAAFNGWLANSAGAVALDDCGAVTWSHDYQPDHWVYTCGNAGYVEVTFTASDACGNTDALTHRFTIGDNSPPVFLNCPEFPIIVNAPQGWCGALVNFSMPMVQDICGPVSLKQIDTTGLTTGSFFPLGLTTLIFEAKDACGNVSYCSYNILVNQYSTLEMRCPESLLLPNKVNKSGANVFNLKPEIISDACEDQIPLVYRILDENNNLLDCGIKDVSGRFFKIGETNVRYKVQDQAILLITEISAGSEKVELELTNFGPSALDLSQIRLVRRGAGAESYILESNTVLLPGATWVQDFTGLPQGAQSAYSVEFFGRVVDGIALNGFQPANFSWSGTLMGNSFARTQICDNDNATDWSSTHACSPGSLGQVNPSLEDSVFDWDGSLVTLQSKEPTSASCSFVVSIVDQEAPTCVLSKRTSYSSTQAMPLNPGECLRVPIEVQEDLLISGIQLSKIQGNFQDLGALTLDLVAPSGQTFTLFSQLCPGSEDFEFSFSDTASLFAFQMPCNPAGQGGLFRPFQSLSSLIGTSGQGTWFLQMYSALRVGGTLEQWNLVLDLSHPLDLVDTLISNQPGICGSNFTWQHPSYFDNCCPGSLRVEYLHSEGEAVPEAKILEGIGGQMETQFFAVGTTHILYTLMDPSGNVSNCGFSLTVENTESPSIDQQLCRDIILYLDPGQCSTPFDYPSLGEVDVCEAVSIHYNPPLDHRFPIGITPVTIEVVNAAGNSTVCEFTVTVLEFEPLGNALFCNSLIRLSLGPECRAEINADMLLEGNNYRCYDHYCIELIDAFGQVIGNSQEGTAFVDLSHVGSLIQARVCSCQSAQVNCCTVAIEVMALSFPIVNCPDDVWLPCNAPWDPEVTGYPLVVNCVPSASIAYFDTFVDLGTCQSPKAQIIRNWLITTDFGDKITCEQNLYFNPLPADSLSFPEDWVGARALSCAEVALDPTLVSPDRTGYPTLGGQPLLGSHFCEFFVSYTDVVHQDINCPGSYQILRNWSLREECKPIIPGVNPLVHTQTLHVRDNREPIFLIDYPDLVISTSSYACSADLDLVINESDILEDCSGIRDLSVLVSGCQVVRGSFGHFQIKQMKKGRHQVRIIASDACLNFGETYFWVQVEDKIPPVAVCAQDLVVALSSEGLGRLEAESIDLGSYDNCGSIRREVFRPAVDCNVLTGPGSYVEFCCSDLGMGPIPVVFRVWDDADGDGIFGSSGDHFNECQIKVTVDSKLLPTFVCPGDLLLDCLDPWEDPEFTGQPQWEGGCDQMIWEFKDSLDLDVCGQGTVWRTWTSPNFPNLHCEQKITLIRSTSLDPNTDIIWPEDWEGNCSDSMLTQRPQVLNATCASIGISSMDQIFTIDPEICYQILRTWTLIDFCTHDTKDPESPGKYTHTQMLRVKSNEAPQMLHCDTTRVVSTGENCQAKRYEFWVFAAEDFCPEQRELFWEFSLDLFSQGNWNPQGQTAGDSAKVILRDLPLGKHNLRITLSDLCGGTSICTQSIWVVDQESPSPICQDEILGALTEEGQVTLEAQWFNLASFDNCTSAEDLQYSFSGDSILSLLSLDCTELDNGISAVLSLPIWVWDQANNRQFCTVDLWLQDPWDYCPDTGSLVMTQLTGSVVNPLDQPIKEAGIELNSNIASLNQKVLTSPGGDFRFEEVMVPGYYTLRGIKNDHPMEGLTTLDLVFMHQHILGSHVLQSPEQLMAADINKDQRIGGEDLIELRNLLLQKRQDFSNNTSWRFYNADQIFENPQHPWPFEEQVSLLLKTAPAPEVRLRGVKIGDVNQSSLGMMTEERTSEQLALRVEDRYMEPKEQWIPVYSDGAKDLSGFQFGLACEGCQIFEAKPGVLSLDRSNMGVCVDGKTLFVWSHPIGADVTEDEPLFYLKLNLNQPQWLSESLRLVPSSLVAEAYFGVPGLVGNVSLHFSKINQALRDRVYQNEPNPFRFQTRIGFDSSKEQAYELQVHAQNGALVLSRKGVATPGYNEWILHKLELSANGVYYYTILTDSMKETRKMVVVD
jgi:hypothetical protein